MRLLFLVFTIAGFTRLYSQKPVTDAAPSERQNYLPVEGGGYNIRIDSTTSTKGLVERLKGNWELRETGKGYWIGYTDDMYSIAARGDSAILLLTELINSNTTLYAKYGAVYTLHLIGIDRTVSGRTYEEFTNMKARDALLDALRHTKLQPDIISLLCRDPRKSDIPAIMKIIGTDSSDCWALNNYLTAFSLNLPVCQDIPESFYGREVKVKCRDSLRHQSSAQFNAVVRAIQALNDPHIYVDSILFTYKSLWGNTAFGILDCDKKNASEAVDITELLYSVTAVTYMDIGCHLQYYIDKSNIFICSQQTAKQRLLNWWSSLTINEKKGFENDEPIGSQPLSGRMLQYLMRNNK